MQPYILIYLAVGLLLAEGSRRQSKKSANDNGFNALSFLMLVLLWPIFILLLILKKP